MLKLFLHGAVPFGYTDPMDDDDAGFNGDEYLRAADEEEGWRHLSRGKLAVTCFATCSSLQSFTCVSPWLQLPSDQCFVR